MNPAYGLLMIAGIIVSATLWRRNAAARELSPIIFVGGLIGAVLGAKLGYIACELPFHFSRDDFWQQLLVGRTVLGGLLGGYIGVEWGKRVAGHREATGDSFALAVPIGLAIGRIGCHLHGCCLGKTCSPAWYTIIDASGMHRYPAPLIEAGFNIIAFVILTALSRRGLLRGQLFHLYLIGYGLFRFAHEFLRDTPRIGPVGTYQLLALSVALFGLWRYRIRASEGAISPSLAEPSKKAQ